jgi:mannose-6-phosphate isomerase-like protein (cupin superfamily)
MKRNRYFRSGSSGWIILLTASRHFQFLASIWARRNRGDVTMPNKIHRRPRLQQGLYAAVLAAGAFITAAPVMAGECPADKVSAGLRTSGETMPKGVTDTVLASVDLAKEKVKLADHKLRTRKLVVQPGGVVPWHSHEDRPALIYIVSGSIH